MLNGPESPSAAAASPVRCGTARRRNLPLAGAGKDEVRHRLPETLVQAYARFKTCTGFRRIYREGGHWWRMRELLAHVARQAAGAQVAPG